VSANAICVVMYIYLILLRLDDDNQDSLCFSQQKKITVYLRLVIFFLEVDLRDDNISIMSKTMKGAQPRINLCLPNRKIKPTCILMRESLN
jgi:hypothetical protein